MAKEPSILDTLANATAETLQQIDARILKLTDEDLATINQELDALRQLRRVINIKLNGKQPRKKSGNPPPKDPPATAHEPNGQPASISDFTRRRQIAKALGRSAMPVSTISANTALSQREVRTLTMSHAWFETLPGDQIKLTRLGIEEQKDA